MHGWRKWPVRDIPSISKSLQSSIASCWSSLPKSEYKQGETMATYHIAVIPGDGIGQEVMPEGIKALRTVQEIGAGLHLEFETFPWGSDYYREHGAMMPEGALKTLAEF